MNAKNIKKLLSKWVPIWLLLATTITAAIPPQTVAANHTNSDFLFHWINTTTIQYNNGATGHSSQFRANTLGNGDVEFLGPVGMPAGQACDNPRGLRFKVVKDVYNRADTTKPTAIEGATYGPIGNRTCDYMDGLIDLINSGSITVGFTASTDRAGFQALADANPDDAPADDQRPSCETTGNPLSWIVCPLINILGEATEQVFDHIIRPLLQTGAINLTDPNDEVFKVWSQFRVLANILLVVGIIVIVFAQATGGGMVDAYTIKKTMPRLLVSAIMINLSIYIVAFAVDITNVLGRGLASLMTLPLTATGEFDFSLSAGGQGLTLVTSIGGLWAGTALAGGVLQFLIFFVLIPAFLSIVAVMFTLLLRRGLIIFLVMISPVAFALYCLPNTEKYFKKWWDTLFKTLLVYPIVVVLFAVADILSVVVRSANSTGGTASSLGQFFSIIIMFAPLFLIPFAFKLAGGTIATIAGVANDKSRGLIDRNKKRNAQRSQYNAKRLAAGTRYDDNNPFGKRVNKLTRGAALLPSAGFNPMRARAKYRSESKRRAYDEAAEFREKNSQFGQFKNNDDFLEAGRINAADGRDGSAASIQRYLSGLTNTVTDENGNETQVRRYSDRQVTEATEQIRAAQNEVSREAYNMAATLAIPATGSGYASGSGEMYAAINEAAGSDRNLAALMMGDARSIAGNANRPDLAAPGFTDSVNELNGLYNAQVAIDSDQTLNAVQRRQASEAAIAGVTRRQDRRTMQAGSAGQIVNARTSTVRRLAPTMMEDLELSMRGYDPNSGDQRAAFANPEEQERRVVREMAALMGRVDTLGQVAPEKAEAVADRMTGQEIRVADLTPQMRQLFDGAITTYERTDPTNAASPLRAVSQRTSISVQEAMNSLRADPRILEMRREYADRREQSVAAQAGMAGGPPGGPQPPGPAPVAGGPAGP